MEDKKGTNSDQQNKAEGETTALKIVEMTSQDYYFDAYAHFRVHEEMLKDKVRTLTYRDAIYSNKHLFAGKVVLDVGCGTGILSLFVAKAGAKRVFAVDASNIVEYAQKIVNDNGFADVITVIKGKIEDISLPLEFPNVDVIVSEWMGYCLLYEDMLSSIIIARDKWLKPGGCLFPDNCCLYIAGVEDYSYQEDKLDWWKNVYGFDMSSMKKLVLREPMTYSIQLDQVVTNVCLLKEFDLYTITNLDVDFSAAFCLCANRNDYVNAFMTFFTVEFTKCHKFTGFSTAPEAPDTHWKQTLFYMDSALVIKRSEQIFGMFYSKRNQQNKQELDFIIKVEFNGELQELSLENSYRMV